MEQVLGLLPPIFDNGSLLVDGGYVNNLPVEVMRDLAPQVSEIVAVDVENKDNTAFENVFNYGESLSVRQGCLQQFHWHGAVWVVRMGGHPLVGSANRDGTVPRIAILPPAPVTPGCSAVTICGSR